MTPSYFVGHPEIEALQMSFAKSGYTALGAGKLFITPRAQSTNVTGQSLYYAIRFSERTGGR